MAKKKGCVLQCICEKFQGVKRGPHAFVVQLRDEETHKTLPGIKVKKEKTSFISKRLRIQILPFQLGRNGHKLVNQRGGIFLSLKNFPDLKMSY